MLIGSLINFKVRISKYINNNLYICYIDKIKSLTYTINYDLPTF
jgi:hypothetical protein